MEGKHYEKTVLLMTISNGSTFGGGFVINPFALTNDGQLDVCIINEVKPLMRFWHLPKLKSGAHQTMKETEFHLTRQLSIAASDQLVAHLDGEYIGHPPFDITVVPSGLLLRAPA